jgi:hypothetical protein
VGGGAYEGRALSRACVRVLVHEKLARLSLFDSLQNSVCGARGTAAWGCGARERARRVSCERRGELMRAVSRAVPIAALAQRRDCAAQ